MGRTRCHELLKRGEIEGVLMGQSRRITRRTKAGTCAVSQAWMAARRAPSQAARARRGP